MAKPTEDLNLAAEVNNYTGDDKSQGDPNSPEYVDPEAPELHGEDDEPSDEEDTEESDEAAEEDGEEDEEPEVDEKLRKMLNLASMN